MRTLAVDYQGLHIELKNRLTLLTLIVNGETVDSYKGMIGPKDPTRFGFWAREAILHAEVNGISIKGQCTVGFFNLVLKIYCDDALLGQKKVMFIT